MGADTTAYQSTYELQKGQSADPWGALIRLCNALNNTPIEALADSLDRILDIDGALWYIAGENILADTDGYNEKGGDYRIFYEEEMGRSHLLQYDANEVMGSGGMVGAGPPPGQDSTQAGAGAPGVNPTGAPPRQGPQFVGPGGNSTSRDPFENQDSANRPLISRLLAVPELRQRYIAHYRTILEETLDWTELGPLMKDYRVLIEREVEVDPIKPSTYAEFQSEFATIEAFVDKRREYLLSLPDFSRPAPAILTVDHAVLGAAKAAQVAGPRAGEPVQVRATLGMAVPVQAVLLHYSPGLSGAFSRIGMADDGMHGDGAAGDGVYGAELPAFAAGTLVRYYIEARAADGAGTAAFSPAGAEHDTYVYQVAAISAASTPVVINELMAANGGAILDPQGEPEDWIELFNLGDQDLALSGMYLSDTEQNPRKWAFPAGTVLAARGYLVVWADEDGGDEPGLHANFKLSADGEQVLLVDVDGRGNQVLDQVQFGAQEADRAFGRMPDGSGGFAAVDAPTPGMANLVPTAVLEEQVRPGRFALGQNYPNPFNSGTLIRFSLLADQAQVALEVYNLSGQRVAILLQGPLPAGKHQFEWNGRDQAGRELATGVYLYRLRAGSAVETRRLLLLR